jgi:hypothetical protein
MANEKYRARAAELLDQSKLEQDPEVAATLATVAECFKALAEPRRHRPKRSDHRAYCQSDCERDRRWRA